MRRASLASRTMIASRLPFEQEYRQRGLALRVLDTRVMAQRAFRMNMEQEYWAQKWERQRTYGL
jgi:hypothetical protein